jgi:stage II sporulation protein R
MKQRATKYTWLIVLIVFCSTCLVSTWMQKNTGKKPADFWRIEPLPAPVVRLHVIANSNHPVDQAFKMQVVEEVQRFLSAGKGFADCDAYITHLRFVMPELQRHLQRFAVKAAPANPEIALALGPAHFPLRAYENRIFPPGEYMALKVTIGEGLGENWWCLLFPSLCLPLVGDSGNSGDYPVEKAVQGAVGLEKDISAPKAAAATSNLRRTKFEARWSKRQTKQLKK